MKLYFWVILCWLLLFAKGAIAGEYNMPGAGNDLVGENYTITVVKGNSLTTIRQQHGVSYDELLEANPEIDFYKLHIGQKIIIPKQFVLPEFREGIVINIPELRLYYFTSDGQYVYTFPVGLGRPGWRTPLISAHVIDKNADPVWRVPDSIRNYVYHKTGELLPDVVLPGPKNPLGKYALRLSKPSYLIHGTNRPTSVGTFISSGCMRLLANPIRMLFQMVDVGTPVHVIHYPSKAGWRYGKLYLESHKSIDYYLDKPRSSLNVSPEVAIYEAVDGYSTEIDWPRVRENINLHIGIPDIIGYRQ